MRSENLPGCRIPRDRALDSTLAMMRDPYRFIGTRCLELGNDVFETRILLRRTYCMSGPGAAAIFYDRERFLRNRVAPMQLQATLFGRGGVQTLDAAAHVHRKRMFLSVMSPASVTRLGEMADGCWREQAQRWPGAGDLRLYDEAREVLCRAVCGWAGVPLLEDRVELRTLQHALLFDSAEAAASKSWSGRMARLGAQQGLRDIIERVRRGEGPAAEGSALRAVALHRELDGELLDARTAAVELLNFLRPTVAVAVFIVFEALAMHRHPEWRRRVAEDRLGEDTHFFVQEVRRFYPFFPAVTAVTGRDFEWQGFRFDAGVRTILDLYGTDRDPRTWEAPEEFHPERMRDGVPDPFMLIPQGGGDPHLDHRCPGEWITLELMRRAARFLARDVAYEVPPQDLEIEMTRLPALPRSRFVINVPR